MEPDPLDLPTLPTVPPAPPPQPSWPTDTGDQPPPRRPPRRPPWPLLGAIGAGLAVLVVIALLVSLLLSARGGMTTVVLGAAAEQTATASSAQATATTAGTPPTSATSPALPHPTATPRPTATPGPTVHVATSSGEISNGVAARCPSGELMLSGGWKADASATLLGSYQYTSGTVISWELNFLDSPGQATASTLCLQRMTTASLIQRRASTTVDAGASGTVIAACAAGEVLVGGGYGNVTHGDLVNSDVSPDHSGFRLTAANHTSFPLHVDAYAECLSAPKARLTVPAPAQQDIGAHGSGAVQVSCPQGALLSGGGINLLNGSAVVTAFAPISATTWQAQIQNQTIVGTTVKLSALCLTFS